MHYGRVRGQGEARLQSARELVELQIQVEEVGFLLNAVGDGAGNVIVPEGQIREVKSYAVRDLARETVA